MKSVQFIVKALKIVYAELRNESWFYFIYFLIISIQSRICSFCQMNIFLWKIKLKLEVCAIWWPNPELQLCTTFSKMFRKECNRERKRASLVENHQRKPSGPYLTKEVLSGDADRTHGYKSCDRKFHLALLSKQRHVCSYKYKWCVTFLFYN